MGKQSAKLFDKPLERVLLATITLNNAALSETIGILKPSDFADNHSREIYRAICKCAESGMVPDMPTIHSTLQDTGASPETLDVLYGLAKTPATVNYAEIILKLKNYSELRFLSAFIEEQRESLQSPGANAEKIISNLRLLTQRQTAANTQNILSLDNLMSMEFPEPKWIVKNLIPEGVSILSASPKIGKSWLLLDVIVSLAAGTPVLGQDVDPAGTLLLALEDSPRRLHSRVRKQHHNNYSGNCEITTQWEHGPDGIMSLYNHIQHKKPALVGIDTLGVFSSMKDGNDYSETTRTLAQIKQLTNDTGASIVLVHHTRKQGGGDADFLERTLGSQGIAGGVDTSLTITRKRSDVDGILQITGRDVEELELAIRFNKDNCRWSVMGQASLVADTRERQQIIELLKVEPLKPKEISDHLGKNPSTVRGLLQKMVQSGNVIKLEVSNRYTLNTTNSADSMDAMDSADGADGLELDFQE